MFEEIIRGIHILPNLHCYITVGDYQGLNMDMQRREWDVIRYDRRPHNPTLCSSTIALLKKEKVLLLTVAPTQNKDLVIDITTKKNSLYLVDLQGQEVTHHNVDMPQLCVPFDYDGTRLLLLEYLKGGKKQLLIYDFGKQQMELVYAIPQCVEFVSFGRLAGNFLVFV